MNAVFCLEETGFVYCLVDRGSLLLAQDEGVKKAEIISSPSPLIL